MKSSTFSPLNTTGQPGGSQILDRLIGRIKAALDVLAQGQISNVSESGGVWLVSPSPQAPTGNPPAGCFYVYTDPLDGKWKTRGAKGTVTVIGTP